MSQIDGAGVVYEIIEVAAPELVDVVARLLLKKGALVVIVFGQSVKFAAAEEEKMRGLCESLPQEWLAE